MSDKKLLKIPTEIKLRTEFFEGYGVKELVQTIIIGAIASIIAYIFYSFTHQTLIATFFVIGIIAVSVIILIKGKNNFSMLDTIINTLKYNFMQKDYMYMRGDFNTRQNIKETKRDKRFNIK